jgi:hypothetical protein
MTKLRALGYESRDFNLLTPDLNILSNSRPEAALLNYFK